MIMMMFNTDHLSPGWLHGGVGAPALDGVAGLQDQRGHQVRGVHPQGGWPVRRPQDRVPARHPPEGLRRPRGLRARENTPEVGHGQGQPATSDTHIHRQAHSDGHTHRQRHTQTDIITDRQTHRQTYSDRHNHRQTHILIDRHTHTQNHRQTHSQTDTLSDKHTHRQAHSQTDHTQTDTHSDRHTHRQTHSQTDTHTHRQTHTDTHSDRHTHSQSDLWGCIVVHQICYLQKL